MSDRLDQGLLDTSVVVDMDLLDPALLPREVAISVITLAELCAGPSATNDASERARRQDRLQRTEAVFDPLPFDVESARAYGRVHAAVLEHGRNRRRRFADLLIASTALAAQLPLVTRNAGDFVGLERLLTIVEV
ncbi:type II toxin-antitoxin system VapC family toxin [uncultured Friedmanniella sp.]|uniref:type II toxin-antitoxin system VapC family toxin n=1 Tax=uncultured Friedmanniella sp. TaxID=335381 RepID=UPI0035CABC95